MIEQLTEGQDAFEIIRTKIASIIALESANQQILAVGEGEDPELWKLRVYEERANAWEQYLGESQNVDETPIVNVWYDATTYPMDSGDVVQRQAGVSVFNVDCYGYGCSQQTPTGHKPGDLIAAENCQRAVRLCRRFLMAAIYTYLGLRGTVWYRWILSQRTFQPEFDVNSVQKILGARLAMEVKHNEISPQVAGETLEYISSQLLRTDNGELLLQADYDYTGV